MKTHDDHTLRYAPVGERWTKIDFDQSADSWTKTKPYQEGTPSKLIELPASWYLDDLPRSSRQTSPNVGRR